MNLHSNIFKLILDIHKDIENEQYIYILIYLN